MCVMDVDAQPHKTTIHSTPVVKNFISLSLHLGFNPTPSLAGNDPCSCQCLLLTWDCTFIPFAPIPFFKLSGMEESIAFRLSGLLCAAGMMGQGYDVDD